MFRVVFQIGDHVEAHRIGRGFEPLGRLFRNFNDAEAVCETYRDQIRRNFESHGAAIHDSCPAMLNAAEVETVSDELVRKLYPPTEAAWMLRPHHA